MAYLLLTTQGFFLHLAHKLLYYRFFTLQYFISYIFKTMVFEPGVKICNNVLGKLYIVHYLSHLLIFTLGYFVLVE